MRQQVAQQIPGDLRGLGVPPDGVQAVQAVLDQPAPVVLRQIPDDAVHPVREPGVGEGQNAVLGGHGGPPGSKKPPACRERRAFCLGRREPVT
ncbi:hypothetical protein GCM10010236_75880 [Streptomyces eurythermus]|nr:hypothetical protein GCM10010236_75880 [Streptomyces eurythermus]